MTSHPAIWLHAALRDIRRSPLLLRDARGVEQRVEDTWHARAVLAVFKRVDNVQSKHRVLFLFAVVRFTLHCVAGEVVSRAAGQGPEPAAVKGPRAVAEGTRVPTKIGRLL